MENLYNIGIDINENRPYLNFNLLYNYYDYKIQFSKVNNFSNFLDKDLQKIRLKRKNSEVKSLSFICFYIPG